MIVRRTLLFAVAVVVFQALATAGTAWAASLEASTAPASEVTQTTAVLNATVTPGGAPVTECMFEYGTGAGPSYGSSVACVSLPGGGASAVSAAVTGLLAHAVYHFRIRATDGTETSLGADETFTTTTELVKAWGENASGQLGNGTTSEHLNNACGCFPVPALVPALTGVISVSAGGDHSLALLNNGTVSSWGANEFGQVGDGSETTRNRPVPVTGLKDVTAVSAGLDHSLALLANGTVMAWGSDEVDQLGDPSQTGSATPVQVPGLRNVVAISAGAYHSLALLSDGTVVGWGLSCFGELAVGGCELHPEPIPIRFANGEPLSEVAAVSAGHYFSLALLKNGTVMAWGTNGSGQLGDGTDTSRSQPTLVHNTSGNEPLHEVVAISAGDRDGMALTQGGEVDSWGNDEEGQAGAEQVRSQFTSPVPMRVSGLNLQGASAIAAGGGNVVAGVQDFGEHDFALALLGPHNSTFFAQGTVISAGYPEYGAIGAGRTPESDYPSWVMWSLAEPNVLTATAISAGTMHGLALVAQPAPAVQTQTSSSITETSASLHAAVDLMGGVIEECRFEFGPTSSYGTALPCEPSPPAGATSFAGVSASVAGLSPDSTYHFRIAATTAGGSVLGEDRAFTTHPEPPTVVMGSASSIVQTFATLNATVNLNGGEAEGCEFEVWPAPEGFHQRVICVPYNFAGNSPIAVSGGIGPLNPNTTYDVALHVNNAGGDIEGVGASFTTLPNPPTPITLTASAITPTTATLNGTVNPHGVVLSPGGCTFEYGTAPGVLDTSIPCTAAPGPSNSAVTVTASLAALTPRTSYYFRLSVTSTGGSRQGAERSLQTLHEAPIVLTEPASAITKTTATLNASVNPNGAVVSPCKLEYGTTTTYGSIAYCSPAPGSGEGAIAVAAAIEKLQPNTLYHFRVVAENEGGASEGADQLFRTVALAPTVLTLGATAVSGTGATFNATVNPQGAFVTTCAFEYGLTLTYGSSAPCTESAGSGTTPVSVSASLSTLAACTTYHVRALAISAGGTGYGEDESTTTPCPHWYRGGVPLIGPTPKPVPMAGTLTLRSPAGNLTCTVKGKAVLLNPPAARAGTDQLLSFAAKCQKFVPGCPAVQVLGLGLPWSGHLAGAVPVRDVIERIQLEVRCAKLARDVFIGTLTPIVAPGVLNFDPGSGALEDAAHNRGAVSGIDAFGGKPAVTAATP